MRGFCERQPDACVVGGKVAVAIGHKAEAGAHTLYDFVSRLARNRPDETVTSRARLAHRPVTRRRLMAPATSTLTPADLAPAWHAPVRCRRAAKPAPTAPGRLNGLGLCLASTGPREIAP